MRACDNDSVLTMVLVNAEAPASAKPLHKSETTWVITTYLAFSSRLAINLEVKLDAILRLFLSVCILSFLAKVLP